MDLKGILAISGHTGLFKMISQAKNGIIVESLIDKKRMPAYTTSKISSLEDIAIFTMEEDVPLLKVLQKVFTHLDGKEALSHKSSSDELKKFFLAVLPDYDQDRVYVSDIKKVVQWYNLLLAEGLIDLEEAKEEEGEEGNDETPEANTEETTQPDEKDSETKMETPDAKEEEGPKE
ncbi:MAG: DUF5606 domain-containing protein [Bacteroidales bacterium]|nr:DUF5606 domain-containing protein [Bacteroidales bacterium]MCF8456451.1 DUF5606 domain-containing protein [Bacteroidales bacterium]